jgi:hypothetical protein
MGKPIELPSFDLTFLRSMLHYDPETGIFRWKQARGRQKVGAIAGALKRTGYIEIRLSERSYLAHRLAWFYVHGEWPLFHIDHGNCCKTDNRIENLRPTDSSLNQANTKIRRKNLTGFKGVYLVRKYGTYYAQAKKWGEVHYLGSYPTPEEASAAYERAVIRFHGEHARVP